MEIRTLTLIPLLLVGFCLLLIVGLPILDMVINNYKTGDFISSQELNCKEFCNGNDYYFSGGGLFSSDECVCKENE